MSRKFGLGTAFAGVAALTVLLSGSFAKADIVTLAFSGTESGDCFGQDSGCFKDPNGNMSYWGNVSGTATWNTITDTASITAVVGSSPYGNLNFSGAVTPSASNGSLYMQLDEDFVANDPYVIDLTIYSPNIVAGVLPGYLALMNSITGVTIGVDNGADNQYPDSTVASSFSLSATGVPAPGALALLGLGLAGLGAARPRKTA